MFIEQLPVHLLLNAILWAGNFILVKKKLGFKLNLGMLHTTVLPKCNKRQE
jgi:hypothetical protein